MGFVILLIIEFLTFGLVVMTPSNDYLTFFGIWSLISSAIFLINAFDLPQTGEKPFTRQDTLDYMKSFTGDHSIHNTFSLNLQYLIIAILNIAITFSIYKIQF